MADKKKISPKPAPKAEAQEDKATTRVTKAKSMRKNSMKRSFQ